MLNCSPGCVWLAARWFLPAPVIAEVGYLVGKYAGARAESLFLRSLANGDFTVEKLTKADYVRMSELVERYADLPLGITDASVVATLDHRHFTVVRPRHRKAFTLLP